ncbi:hypothetical protein RAS1_08700 [Phycisphaerae bacterium RAS1]|nr:hypothetical protein RAS1_08700 [Phycisphaerae bacterium RAS1]
MTERTLKTKTSGTVSPDALAGDRPRRVFRDGYAFRKTATGSRLYIFTHRRLQVIAVEAGTVRQWLVRTNGTFHGSRRHISLDVVGRFASQATQDSDGQLLFFPLYASTAACRDFLTSLPEGIVDRARLYPEPMHFRMLGFFVRCGNAAADLHDGGARGLCAALAAIDRFSATRNPTRTMKSWVWQPQHVVLGKLGWPDTKSAARLMRKLPAESSNFWVLHAMRQVSHDAPTALRLAHLKRVNDFVAWSVSRPAELVDRLAWPLVEESSALESSPALQAIGQFRSLLRMEAELTRRGRESPAPRRLRSLTQLGRACQQVSDLHESVLGADGDRTCFPEPPLPDEPGFVTWIRCGGALREEGAAMQHCALSYLRDAASGDVAIASIHHQTERATLRIRRRDGGRWVCAELKGVCNAPPSQELHDTLAAWLRRMPNCSSEAEPEIDYDER